MKVTEEFKNMINEDIQNSKDALYDICNKRTLEGAKLELYLASTARYHPYVPNSSEGMLRYYSNNAFYDDVKGDSLRHNIGQVYKKSITFKASGYPSLISIVGRRSSSIIVNTDYTNQNTNNNSNENNNIICISFD